MQNRDLNLAVGSSLLLEKMNNGHQFMVELLGYSIGRSVMVTIPQESDGRCALVPDELVILRYHGGSNHIAFQSRVSYLAFEPYPHIHVDYPMGVQGRALRKKPRVDVDSEAQISLSLEDHGRQVSVKMINISETGARLVANRKLANSDETFTIEIPMMSGNQVRVVALACVVRHVNDIPFGPNKEHHHGVEFESVDDSARAMIHRFMQKKIVESA